jgi:hypothetical protein
MLTLHAEDIEDAELKLEEVELKLELGVTKLSEVKTDPMGPVAEVLIVATELADKNLQVSCQFHECMR